MKEEKIIKSREEVESFVHRFLPKMDIWGISFFDRNKNNEALKILGITEEIRKEIIREIEVKDYVETIVNVLYYNDLWVFGKDFDGKELYIKIALGNENNRTICISFHIAEHPLNRVYK